MTNEEARLILINYLYNLKKLDKKVFTAMILALAALSDTVYCKDCKHLTYEDWGTGKTIMFCDHFGDDIGFHGMTENDYCSQGERKEE